MAWLYPTAGITQDLIGRASVIDGDTLEIHGSRIRLFGIDAPESGQICEDGSGAVWRCGRAAAFVLDDLVQGKTVSCIERDRDRYGRIVATCDVGTDLGGAMVASGMAVAYQKYSRRYVDAESQARNDGLGLWAGPFDMPWDWRASH